MVHLTVQVSNLFSKGGVYRLFRHFPLRLRQEVGVSVRYSNGE